MAGSNHPGNPVNSTPAKSVHSRSKFPLHYKFLNTERFGYISLTTAQDIVRGDHFRLSNTHSLRSYTLKSPFFGAIRKSKDFFFVAKDAILPINADKVNVQPTIGNDIPEGVNCSVYDFVRKYYLYCKEFFDVYVDGIENINVVSFSLYWLILLSYVFSPGSLLAQSGYNVGKSFYFYFPDDSFLSLDKFFDLVIDEIVSGDLSFTYGDDGIRHYNTDKNYRDVFRLVLDDLQDDPSNIQKLVFYGDTIPASIEGLSRGDVSFSNVPRSLGKSLAGVLNFGRLASYHIACNHYYSNDKIDYIFSAELYRELVGNSIVRYQTASGELVEDDCFMFNGIRTRYDWLSGHYLDMMLTGSLTNDNYLIVGQYLSYLFSFKRSLRYVDYFVGGRSNPLAVGDVNVPVSGDGVNVVEIAKKTGFARLLAATNQLGSRARQWLEGIFKGAPDIKWDKHDPMFIGHLVDMVNGEDTENTGNAVFEDVGDINTSQVSTTSVFRSRSSRSFAFEFDCAMPGYIIGVTYYDIPRVYTASIDRQMMAYDRYDEFNPFMQYVGDQPIYLREMVSDDDTDRVFAYQQKDMQYKQTFSRSAGGFSEGVLPSWFFDDEVFLSSLKSSVAIGPEFIRSRSVELDKFYLSLTGWSYSTYFHFICCYNNDLDASRPMTFIATLNV